MAEKQVNLAQGYGGAAYDKYESARRSLEDALAKRENRLFDPTLLAMAQGFLAPTKTGSFGESLGNAAGAVVPVQQAEDKRILDMAKIRLDMAEQGLKTDINLKKQQGLADFLKNNTAEMPGMPAAPAAAPAVQGANAAAASVMPPGNPLAQSSIPAQPIGGLPTGTAPAAPAGALSLGAATPPAAPPAAPPMAAPNAAPTLQQTPQPAQPNLGFMGGIPLGVPGAQTGNPNGYNFNKQEANYFKLGMANDKSPTDLIKDINEMRSKEMETKEGYVFHRPSRTVYPILSPDQVEIQLPGDKAPRKVFKHDSLAYQVYDSLGDPRAQEYLNKMKYGNKMGPPTTPGTPSAPAATSSGLPTTADVAADKARAEAEAKVEGEGSGKRTSAAKDKVDQAIESKNAALSVKDLISQPNSDLALGVFEKPTIKAAILGMVNDSVFSEDKFRDAYTKTNIKFNIPQKRDETRQEYDQRKQDVYDRAAQVASQAAYLQFQVSMLAKGQGAISNMERTMFANTTVGVRDTVATMNKKADMIIERANFAQKVADKLTDGVSIDQFRKTPEYKKMEKDYENSLRNIWNPSRSKAQSSSAPLTPEQMQAARDRVNGVLK